MRNNKNKSSKCITDSGFTYISDRFALGGTQCKMFIHLSHSKNHTQKYDILKAYEDRQKKKTRTRSERFTFYLICHWTTVGLAH